MTTTTVLTPADLHTDHFNVQAGQKITLKDALLNAFFKAVTATTDANGDSVLRFTRHDNTTVDVPAATKDLVLDIDPTKTKYDASTMKLTLQVKGATAPNDKIVIDLQELSKTSTQDSNSVELVGDGTASNKLQANVKLKTNGGLTVTAAGVEVAPQVTVTDLAGNTLFRAFN